MHQPGGRNKFSFWNADSPLSLTSTMNLPIPLSSNVAWTINPAFFGTFPTIEFDSWVTLGVMNQNEVSGSPATVGMSIPFAEFAAGGDLIVDSVDGGAWFTILGDPEAQAGDDLKVLLAQLTVSMNAVISGTLNIQLFVNGLQSNTETYHGVTLPQISLEGCTFEIACNYDPGALVDDGSCVFICEGCTDSDACNFDSTASVDDGTCEYLSCVGCTDNSACNFLPSNTIEDGSCVFPEYGYNCDEECISDADGDGICDLLEIPGCLDINACNFDSSATESNDSCEYESCAGCMYELACNYDPSATIADNSMCEFGTCGGCLEPSACNFNPTVGFDDGSCSFPESDLYDCEGECISDIDGDGICDGADIFGCTDEFACNYNEEATQDDGSCEYCGESCGETTGYTLTVEVHAEDIVSGFTTFRIYQNMQNLDDFLSAVIGNEDAPFVFETTTGFYNSQYGGAVASSINPAFLPFFPDVGADSWVTIGIESQNVGDEVAISTVESTDQPWVNAFAFGQALSGQNIYMNDATGGAWYVLNNTPNGVPDENGRVLIMQVTTSGELSGTFNTQVFEHGIGSQSIYSTFEFSGVGQFGTNGFINACGCTDSLASNYDETAEYDDGSCEYPLLGCTDSAACNFNPDATTDDESCEFPEFGYDCLGDCIADVDSDGVCDANEIPGCTQSEACNFNSEATDDDGSCSYPQSDLYDCEGLCVNDLDEDGICDENEVLGCSYSTACNFDPVATDDNGNCVFPDAGFDCDGNCLFDDDGDGICDQDEVVGCSDELACNYIPSTTEDGLCDYESCIVEGCMDATACNYNPNASVDDLSCLYLDECNVCGGIGIPEGACDCEGVFPPQFYGCDGVCLNDTDGDGICDELEISGCTDEIACNFQVEATDDSGECDYCTCLPVNSELPYTLTVEAHAENIIPGMTTYRFYIDMLNDDDFLSSIYGNNNDPFYLMTEAGFYNDPIGSSIASSINPALIAFFPTLEADSWMTIGIDSQNVGAEVAISTLESSEQPFVAAFSSGSAIDGQDVLMDDATGGAWYVLNGTPNGLPDADGRVLFLQLTTAGAFEAQINAQIFPNGSGAGAITNAYVIDGLGTFYDSQYSLCGCNNPIACNYDELATHDDGSCTYDCLGCTDNSACNFNPTSTQDDGSCELPDIGYDCQGECILDTDGDGVCDANEVLGCSEEQACNYNALATDDDGSCIFPISSNHDCSGTCFNDADGDTICDEDEVYGCTYVDACNYDEDATDDDGSCQFPEDGFNCNGTCLFDEDGDDVCDENEVTGCQDPAACNFLSLATDMGYCSYPELNYDCQGNCINDTDGDGICDEDEVPGCMDASACNYVATATDEDGSCDFPEPGYNCQGLGTINGCMDDSACNFNPTATIETVNDICLYPLPHFDCLGTCLNDADGDGICDEVEALIDDEIQNAIDEINEEFIAALANGDYCGQGTVWVQSWQECVAIPTCFGDHNLDGTRGTEDLLLFLAVYGTDCPSELGCPDPKAFNFDPAATEDDGSCEYYGCTVATACNYPLATIDDVKRG